MLFSDWDGSGRRDLRVSNDRHYYGELGGGGEQLWRFEPGTPPRAYTAADGWALLRLWGMGIASYDLTGDGYPEVYLTSQGANTLQTLVAGPSEPAYHGMARDLGVEATRPVVGGDPLPSTAWHPEFQDVNNDGYMDLLVTKGNVNQIPDYAQKDPNNLFLGRPDGRTSRAPRRPGSSRSTWAAGPRSPTSTATGCSTSWSRTSSRPPGCGATSAAARPMRPRRWAAGSASGCTSPARTATPSAPSIETRVGERVARREIVVGGGHAGGQLGWTHLGLGRRRERGRAGHLAGRRDRPVDDPRREPVRGHRPRRDRRRAVDAAGPVSGRPMTGVRLATVEPPRLRRAGRAAGAAGRALRRAGRAAPRARRRGAASTGWSSTPIASTARTCRS